MQVIVYLIIIVIVSILDIRSMLRLHIRKDMVPYLFCMMLAGLLGVIYLANPYRESIVGVILNVFHIQG